MPRLSWNEIENRAVQFSAHWAGETYEKGESQSFWSDFLDIFWPDKLLADFYDPFAMPKELVDAHHKLDRAVDRLY